MWADYETVVDYDVRVECGRYLYVSVDSARNLAVPELASFFKDHPEYKEIIESLSHGASYASLHEEYRRILHIVRDVYADAYCRQHPGEKDKWHRRRRAR